MSVRLKAGFLTAGACALVIAGAGSASAHSHHHGFFSSLFGGGVEQENTCATVPGPLTITPGAAAGTASPAIENETDCFNLDATGGGASEQENNCTTAPGATILTGLLTPAGPIENETRCANIAF